MKERDFVSRQDVSYPFERRDSQSNVIETLAMPQEYDVRFIYYRGKKGQPMFRIFAQRLNKEVEQYEIDIQGHKRIKGVMKQFDHEYMAIVDNLRIMGDALVLLNPTKNSLDFPSKSVQIPVQN